MWTLICGDPYFIYNGVLIESGQLDSRTTKMKDTLLCAPGHVLCSNHDSCADEDHVHVVQFIEYICGNSRSPSTMDGRASEVQSIWETNCYIIYGYIDDTEAPLLYSFSSIFIASSLLLPHFSSSAAWCIKYHVGTPTSRNEHNARTYMDIWLCRCCLCFYNYSPDRRIPTQVPTFIKFKIVQL